MMHDIYINVLLYYYLIILLTYYYIIILLYTLFTTYPDTLY